MNPRPNKFSRKDLLDDLLKSVRAANALQLEDLAYDLSVAIAEERLRLKTEEVSLPPKETPHTSTDNVIPFPVR